MYVYVCFYIHTDTHTCTHTGLHSARTITSISPTHTFSHEKTVKGAVVYI